MVSQLPTENKGLPPKKIILKKPNNVECEF